MGAAPVSVRVIAKLIAAATAMGANPVELIAALGLTPEQLGDRETRVRHAVLLAAWQEAGQRTGDGNFGLHAAELSRRSPDNVLAYAFQHSATLGEGLRRVARYMSLAHSGAELEVLELGDTGRLRARVLDPLGSTRHGIEFVFSMACIAAREYVPGFAVRSMHFRHPRPADCSEHQRIFAAPLHFAAERDELVFDRAFLDGKMRDADSEVCDYLARLLEQYLLESTGAAALVDRVRRAVAEELRGGRPDVEVVAARLHLSARSLQRKLQEHDTSFQEVVNDLRRDMASRYLAESRVSVAEVAFLLGFAEVSNFHRAFKRWTGRTPAEWRKRKAATSP